MSQPFGNLLINGANGVTVGGLGTTVKFFPAVPGASINAVSPNIGLLPVPGVNRLNGQSLEVRASGNFLTPGSDAVSPAVTIGLYFVKGPVLISNAMNLPTGTVSPVALATLQEPAGTPGIVSVPWSIKAQLNADNASGLLQGLYTIQIDNGAPNGSNSTPLLAIAAQSGVNMALDIPYALCVGVTFSQTGTGNTATM
ncbi:MAG: hypothetical protein OK457_00730, partial [Thaumarchaeota archaeon]|nr:hypothetical protein [Nitrososphaerota archaeon]